MAPSQGPTGMSTMGSLWLRWDTMHRHCYQVELFFILKKALTLVFSAAECSTVYSNSNIVLLSPKPKQLPPFWNMTKPFSKRVWAFIFATFFLASVLFSLLAKFVGRSICFIENGKSWNSSHVAMLLQLIVNQSKKIKHNKKFPIFDHFHFPGSRAFRTQNISLTSKGVYVTSWLFFLFCTDAAFECNLRAYLMAVEYEPKIDSDRLTK